MSFKKFICLEIDRLFDWRKLLILLLFYLLAVYFIQSGIGQYKDSLEEKKRFQEFEKIKVENFQYYAQYGTYGFRLFYIPGLMSALFSNAGIITTNLNAFIDAGERMKIYESFKGKNAFIGYTSIFLNLNGILFVFGSLLALFYGLETYKYNEFLKFLVNIKDSRKKVFWFAFLSRLLFLLGFCLVIALTAWILFMINGFTGIDIGQLIIYYLVSFLMLGFFLFAGMVAGLLKTKQASMIAIFAVWLLFVFIIPAAVGKIVYNHAESIVSTYEMEHEKFKLMMEIERKAKEQVGKLDAKNTNTKIRQQLHEYFWNNEFREILGKEQAMINEMKGVVSLHHNLSLIFPTSFFLSVNNEISGRGHECLISFYEHVFKLKTGFIQYYAKKSFYSNEKIVKPYLNGEENIFYAPNLLPDNFSFGFLISLFWLLLLIFLSWISFNRMLDYAHETSRELSPDELKKSKTNVIFTSDKGLLPQLITKLRSQNISFLLFPGPASLPGDIMVKNLLSFFGLSVPEALQEISVRYVYTLEKGEKVRVLIEIVKSLKADVLIFDNFLAGASDELVNYFADVLNSLKKGRIVVYFTDSFLVSTVISDCGLKWSTEKISF